MTNQTKYKYLQTICSKYTLLLQFSPSLLSADWLLLDGETEAEAPSKDSQMERMPVPTDVGRWSLLGGMSYN
jgi:hypothetical protein